MYHNKKTKVLLPQAWMILTDFNVPKHFCNLLTFSVPESTCKD